MEKKYNSMPQYIHETEALLMTPYFANEADADALYDDFESIEGKELGAREIIYAGALRILAQGREKDKPLTARNIAVISSCFPQEIGRLARQLAILNNAEAAIDPYQGATGYEGLLGYQKPFLKDILTMLQRGRTPVNLPGFEDRHVQGILVDAPTGSGKTAMIARTAASTGIGRPADPSAHNAELRKKVRGLLVTPSHALIAQLTGKTGKNILQQLAPGMTVSSYYSKHKDLSGDLIVTTPESVGLRLRDGYFVDEPLDILFIDEAHHFLRHLFAKTVLDHWRGPIVGYTATRKYDEMRDTANILPYGIHHGTMEDFMKHGYINKLELFTASVTPEDIDLEQVPATSIERRVARQTALTQMAADFTQTMVAEGRRGIVFCETGNDQHHAHVMRDALNQIKIGTGKTIQAEVIGGKYGSSNSPYNRSVINRYNDGEIDVITTTEMGREGLDFKAIDFVCIAGRSESLLKIQQAVGRGTRLNKTFPTTPVGYFIGIGFSKFNRGTAALQRIIGQDTIRQGYIVGGEQETAPARHAFPPRLQEILDRFDNRPISLIRNRRAIPLGYVSLADIIDGEDIGYDAARLQLIRHGYDGIQQKQASLTVGRRDVFFEPAAATFFTDTPQQPVFGEPQDKELKAWGRRSELTTLEDLAKRLNQSLDTILYYLSDDEKEQGRSRRVAQHDRYTWDDVEATAIVDRLEKRLFIPAHLLTFTATSELIGVHPNTLRKHTKRHKEALGFESIVPRGTAKEGIPWSGVRKLQAVYGLRGAIAEIDYDRLPLDAADKDPQKIAYARQLQRKVMPAKWLPPDATTYYENN